jgi:hypothetical protein
MTKAERYNRHIEALRGALGSLLAQITNEEGVLFSEIEAALKKSGGATSLKRSIKNARKVIDTPYNN